MPNSGTCRILVPLRYTTPEVKHTRLIFVQLMCEQLTPLHLNIICAQQATMTRHSVKQSGVDLNSQSNNICGTTHWHNSLAHIFYFQTRDLFSGGESDIGQRCIFSFFSYLGGLQLQLDVYLLKLGNHTYVMWVRGQIIACLLLKTCFSCDQSLSNIPMWKHFDHFKVCGNEIES